MRQLIVILYPLVGFRGMWGGFHGADDSDSDDEEEYSA